MTSTFDEIEQEAIRHTKELTNSEEIYNKSLNTFIACAKRQMEQRIRDISKYIDENKTLKTKKKTLETEKQTLETSLLNLQQDFAQLREEKERDSIRTHDLQQGISSSKEEAEELRRQLAAVEKRREDDLNKMQQELIKSHEASDKLLEEKERDSIRIHDLQQGISASKEEAEELRRQLDAVEMKLDQSRETSAKMLEEKERDSLRIHDLQQGISASKEEAEELCHQLLDVKLKWQEDTNALRLGQEEIISLRGEIARLRDQNTQEQQQEMEAIAKENAELRQQLEEINSFKDDLPDDLDDLKNTVASVLKDNDWYCKRVLNLEKEIRMRDNPESKRRKRACVV